MVSLTPDSEQLVSEQHSYTPEQPNASEPSHLQQTSLDNQVEEVHGVDDLSQTDNDSALGSVDTG